jgi:limonene 1,2-monooxygenase
MSMNWPLRFGVFHAPFHDPLMDPTLAFDYDLALIEHLDRLGFEEAWFGEHHSSGWELINCPELMIAAAAQRTRNIRLGTGAVSLSYHHPFLLADRIVQLDHMTRGRLMFGVAPGALPADAQMLCIPVADQRRRMEQALDSVVHLLSSAEPLTVKTDWFEMRDARLQLRPFSRPGIEMAVTSVASPWGPRLAARHGAGILSVGATSAIGFDALAATWSVMEAESAALGHTPDRSKWRVTGPIHLADTEEQARADVRYGLQRWVEYWSVASQLELSVNTGNIDKLIDDMNDSGFAVIGTPDRMIGQLERLINQSDGGLGAFLVMSHEWANRDATFHSYELLANVVGPRFRGTVDARLASYEVMRQGRNEFLGAANDAAAAAAALYAAEVAQRSDSAYRHDGSLVTGKVL